MTSYEASMSSSRDSGGSDSPHTITRAYKAFQLNRNAVLLLAVVILTCGTLSQVYLPITMPRALSQQPVVRMRGRQITISSTISSQGSRDLVERIKANLQQITAGQSEEQLQRLNTRLESLLRKPDARRKEEASPKKKQPSLSAGTSSIAQTEEQADGLDALEKDEGSAFGQRQYINPFWWAESVYKDAKPLAAGQREALRDNVITQTCQEWRTSYTVRPGKDWGTLPHDLQQRWLAEDCDEHLEENVSAVPVYTCTRPEDKEASKLPLIGVMAAATTRGVEDLKLGKLALFTHLLPSLIRTLECGFKYRFFLGCDQDDAFYATIGGRRQVEAWFETTVREPLAKAGMQIELQIVPVDNQLSKPGPVFLEMARAAYAAGANYFFRVNDDTEILNPWASKFVRALEKLGPPYGSVGPLCRQGNTEILTHDFTHRLHMEIFEGNYYPPELSDWWMDDWIGRVYGSSRTRQSKSVEVHHYTRTHGQRYSVDPSHEHLLTGLVEDGKQRILAWMDKNEVKLEARSEFADARFDAFPLQDIRRRK